MLFSLIGTFYSLMFLFTSTLITVAMGASVLQDPSLILATCVLSRFDYRSACSFMNCSVMVHVIPHSQNAHFALNDFILPRNDLRDFNLSQVKWTRSSNLSCYFLAHNPRHIYFPQIYRNIILASTVRSEDNNPVIIAVVVILTVLGVLLPYVFILRFNAFTSPNQFCIHALWRLGLSSRDPAIRTSHPSQSATNTDHYQSPTLPSATRPRCTVADLIQESIISEEEADQLRKQSWLCCICLEDVPFNSPLPPIARLSCGHATHAQCLRMWLEKGRAVCCLCNAPAVSSVNDDCASSDATSISMFDPTASSSAISQSTGFSSFSRSYSVLTESESFEHQRSSLAR